MSTKEFAVLCTAFFGFVSECFGTRELHKRLTQGKPCPLHRIVDPRPFEKYLQGQFEHLKRRLEDLQRAAAAARAEEELAQQAPPVSETTAAGSRLFAAISQCRWAIPRSMCLLFRPAHVGRRRG